MEGLGRVDEGKGKEDVLRECVKGILKGSRCVVCECMLVHHLPT